MLTVLADGRMTLRQAGEDAQTLNPADIPGVKRLTRIRSR
jgi:hypothetical protein